MRKNKNLFRSFIIALFFLSSCAIKSDDPKIILSDFIDAMHKKEFAKAEKLSTKESKEYFIAIEKLSALTNSPYLQDSSYFNKSKITIGPVKIEHEMAHIAVAIKAKDSTINTVYILKKETGEWKVAFDFASQANLKPPGK